MVLSCHVEYSIPPQHIFPVGTESPRGSEVVESCSHCVAVRSFSSYSDFLPQFRRKFDFD